MNLTGQELIDKGIITGNESSENIQQHGVDLNVIKIESMFGVGRIPTKGKTRLVDYKEIEQVILLTGSGEEPVENSGWRLNPGTYQVLFEQGCNVPSDQRLDIVQRSSCSRNGLFIRSAIFDAGYSCKQMGTIILVTIPIEIEFKARIGQIVAIGSNTVENVYNGQFQGK